MTRTYNGNLGFKSWQKQETNITTKTSRQAPSGHSASNSMKTTAFSLAVKWPGQTVTTIICLEPSFKIGSVIPLINLSASMANSGTTLYSLYPLRTYISFKRSHPFWPYRGTFSYITYLLHTQCMTHLFHLHWTNHINAKYSKSKISQNTTNLLSII